MYYLGYDLGSSSVKVAIVDSETNRPIANEQYPDQELPISSPYPGWAEQDPEMWWESVIQVTRKVLTKLPSRVKDEISGIGISYQMHGLVLVDKELTPVRPSIIWCDSRAVESGEEALRNLKKEECFKHLLNEPGNFTASKLRWVRDNEPEVLEKTHKIMLPGDFIAAKMTGDISTTLGGLSEGIMWDFLEHRPAEFMFSEFGITKDLLPEVIETFSNQGKLSSKSAEVLGLKSGIPICYRAGDQPNNAMSLGVLEPGQMAGTGGTSGVIYGVNGEPTYDEKSRVNNFGHINHTKDSPKIGVLLCINGAGILYSWIRKNVAQGQLTYTDLESRAGNIAIGSEGLRILPFGNGAERILENRDVGVHLSNLQLTQHSDNHIYRAALEGIAFSFYYGMKIMSDMGLKIDTMKVGNDNLFQSRIFSETISTLNQCQIEITETTGATGAAKAVGFALGHRSSLAEAMAGNEIIKEISPLDKDDPYQEGYALWKSDLENILARIRN